MNSFIRFLCLTFLFVSGTAFAAQFENDVFSVEVPDGWQVLQRNEFSAVNIVVFSNARKDTLITVATGSAWGADVKTISESFALQYRAKKPPVIKNNRGTFNFINFEGLDGLAVVTVQDDVYMTTIIVGDITRGRQFVRTFVSGKYASLLPEG